MREGIIGCHWTTLHNLVVVISMISAVAKHENRLMIASQEHATIITFLLPKTQCSLLEVQTLEPLERFDAHGF